MKTKIAHRSALVAVLAVSLVTLLGVVPSNAEASTSGRSHTATSKDWTVTLWVARTSSKPGESIPATVTVDNRTNHRIELVGCPGTDYEIIAGSSMVPNSPVIPTVLCASEMSPGVHVFHTKVQTMYVSCGGGAGSPPCGKPPKLISLPVGTYHTQLILPGAEPSLPMPQALNITLET
jgi:hypothetical protein